MLSLEFEMLVMKKDKSEDEIKEIQEFMKNGEIKDIDDAVLASEGASNILSREDI